MKRPKFGLLLLLMFLSIAFGCNSNINPVESNLCKEWIMKEYEADGVRQPPPNYLKNNRLVFYNDHTVTSLEDSSTKYGEWKLDAATNVLVITDLETDFELINSVITITDSSFTFQIGSAEEGIIKVHMKPAESKAN